MKRKDQKNIEIITLRTGEISLPAYITFKHEVDKLFIEHHDIFSELYAFCNDSGFILSKKAKTLLGETFISTFRASRNGVFLHSNLRDLVKSYAAPDPVSGLLIPRIDPRQPTNSDEERKNHNILAQLYQAMPTESPTIPTEKKLTAPSSISKSSQFSPAESSGEQAFTANYEIPKTNIFDTDEYSTKNLIDLIQCHHPEVEGETEIIDLDIISTTVIQFSENISFPVSEKIANCLNKEFSLNCETRKSEFFSIGPKIEIPMKLNSLIEILSQNTALCEKVRPDSQDTSAIIKRRKPTLNQFFKAKDNSKKIIIDLVLHQYPELEGKIKIGTALNIIGITSVKFSISLSLNKAQEITDWLSNEFSLECKVKKHQNTILIEMPAKLNSLIETLSQNTTLGEKVRPDSQDANVNINSNTLTFK